MKKYSILLAIQLFISLDCSEPSKELNDTTPPEIHIVTPSSDSLVKELVTIMAYAKDNTGIQKVEFLINDTLSYLAEKLDTLYFIEWNSTLFENNKYKLQAIAKDVSENLTETIPIFITVDNSNSAPKAQNILNIIYNQNKMTITWEPFTETDFKAYEILISESYNGLKSTLITINDSSITSYTTTEFNPGIVHYYWLKVVDIYNYSSIGNGYRLVDAIPTQVNLNSLELTNYRHKFYWDTNTDSDFVSYTLSMLRDEVDLQDTVLFFSNDNLDTSFNAPFILTEKFYQIIVKDYWALSSKSDILEIDFGPAPIILNVSTPDTILRPELDEKSLYLISASIIDGNGLESIDIAGFISYLLIEDTLRVDSTYYSLFDDGGVDTLLGSFYTSGDTIAGDGWYCTQILIDVQTTVGVYDWVFKANDINRQPSDPFQVRVVIE